MAGDRLVIASDFADEVVESVVNVNAGLGGGLDEFATEGLGERSTLCDTC